MHAFAAALVWLVSTFFPWHYFMFFLLLKIVSVIYQPGTIPAVCERAAKVIKYFNFKPKIKQKTS